MIISLGINCLIVDVSASLMLELQPRTLRKLEEHWTTNYWNWKTCVRFPCFRAIPLHDIPIFHLVLDKVNEGSWPKYTKWYAFQVTLFNSMMVHRVTWDIRTQQFYESSSLLLWISNGIIRIKNISLRLIAM